ncbi:MAG: hypothetical protein RLP09_02665 [Sandaracinaceae bacterium]
MALDSNFRAWIQANKTPEEIKKQFTSSDGLSAWEEEWRKSAPTASKSSPSKSPNQPTVYYFVTYEEKTTGKGRTAKTERNVLRMDIATGFGKGRSTERDDIKREHESMASMVPGVFYLEIQDRSTGVVVVNADAENVLNMLQLEKPKGTKVQNFSEK